MLTASPLQSSYVPLLGSLRNADEFEGGEGTMASAVCRPQALQPEMYHTLDLGFRLCPGVVYPWNASNLDGIDLVGSTRKAGRQGVRPATA